MSTLVIGIQGGPEFTFAALSCAAIFCDNKAASSKKILVVENHPYLTAMTGYYAFDEVITKYTGGQIFHHVGEIIRSGTDGLSLVLNEQKIYQEAVQTDTTIFERLHEIFQLPLATLERPLILFPQSAYGNYIRAILLDKEADSPRNIGMYILMSGIVDADMEVAIRYVESIKHQFKLPFITLGEPCGGATLERLMQYSYHKTHTIADGPWPIVELLVNCAFHVTNNSIYHQLAAALEIPTLCIGDKADRPYRYDLPMIAYRELASGIPDPDGVASDCRAVADDYSYRDR